MNCEPAKPLIQPYADGELDAAGILEMERHLQNCPECSLAWRNLQGLKKAIQQESLYFTAPTELRRQLKAEFRMQSEPAPRKRLWDWNWLTATAIGAAAVCLAILLPLSMNESAARRQLANELVSSHVRSLMVNHALDVVSSDQHTVKPWFDGKLDFAPPVKDLASQEFPLLGGRLDYIGGRTVAALIFQRHKHVINLFIWPSKETDSQPAASASLQGYHLVHWSQSGMTFWAVSDVNEAELMQFGQDFAAAQPLAH